METVTSAPGFGGSARSVKRTGLTRCKPSATIWRKLWGVRVKKRRIHKRLSEKKNK